MVKPLKNRLFESNIFNVILLLVSFVGLVYMGLQAFAQSNIGMGFASFIFAIMNLAVLVLNPKEVLGTKIPIGLSSLSFFIAFTGMYLFKSATNFAIIEQQNLLSTLSSQIPASWNLILSVFMAPTIEEFFFIGMAGVVIILMELLGVDYPLLKNKILQMIVIIVLGGWAFAIFHTGKTAIAFVVVAFTFRAVAYIFLFGDRFFDIIPILTIGLPFVIGIHMANNYHVLTTSFFGGLRILAESGFGIILIFMFSMFFLFALDYVWRKLTGRTIR